MGIFDRFFGKPRKKPAQAVSQTRAPKKEGLGLADPGHRSRTWIVEASQMADQVISLQVVGSATMMQSDTGQSGQLVSAIDKALENAPDDLDLLVAKSGALCCALQFKTGEEILDQVLAIDPDRFEARMRKDHWEKWQHLFGYPSWSEKAATLHPIMAAHLRHAHPVQVVRDGLQIGIAVINPVRRQDFPQGLSPQVRSKWEPVWSDTPYGAIVAHYLVVEDVPGNPWKNEAFLPLFVPDEVTPTSGYWLLQRMSNLASCFLVLADGNTVLYNKRYVFPRELRSTLRSITEKATQRAAKKDIQAFQNAQQWHMQNFDMGRIRF